jgi:hypothetical protein
LADGLEVGGFRRLYENRFRRLHASWPAKNKSFPLGAEGLGLMRDFVRGEDFLLDSSHKTYVFDFAAPTQETINAINAHPMEEDDLVLVHSGCIYSPGRKIDKRIENLLGLPNVLLATRKFSESSDNVFRDKCHAPVFDDKQLPCVC